jgi:hypothetical protein
MTVLEYRKNHPNCKFCNHKHFKRNFCIAKAKHVFINEAKKCPIYYPTTTSTDIER